MRIRILVASNQDIEWSLNLKDHLRKRQPKSFEEFKDAEREQPAKAKAEEEGSKVKRLGGVNGNITGYVVKQLGNQ